MLPWKRHIPKTLRSLIAVGTLSALVALAVAKPYTVAFGQEPAPRKEQTKEPKSAPVKESEQKDPVKKSDEKAPVKESEQKDPVKKSDEKAPVKESGAKDPVKKTDEKVQAPRKTDPANPGRVPGKEDPKGGQLLFNGGISFDAKNSSTCGKGQICYSYVLPTLKTPAGIITGTLVITLNIYQHGSTTPLVFTPPTLMQSGVLKDGDHFCFAVNPTTFPGIDLTVGAFDFVASAKFTLAGNDTTILVGSVPQGVIPDRNNDYQIECKPSTGTKGEIVYDARSSTTCGKGKICFNFKLPTMKDEKGNVINTSGEISLTLYQNGMPKLTLPPGLAILSDIEGFRKCCFLIDPANIPQLDPALGGFDFVATAAFPYIGPYYPFPQVPLSAVVGKRPTGIKGELNDDYQIQCEGGSGTKGEIVYDARTSTTCGKGQICFNLKLPTMMDEKGNVITASGQIHLTLYQNGQPVLSLLPSPVLNDKTGARYCYPIDPANMEVLNPALGGFDFVATATFNFGLAGIAPTSAVVGTAPNGIIPDRNNDYKIFCGEDPGHPIAHDCCLGRNLVQNGDFESNVAIVSQYQPAGSMATLKPGTYIKYKVDYIKEACSNWQLPKGCSETKDFDHEVLFVNGLTNQIVPAPASAVIWEQQIPVSETKEKYRVCFRYLPLPQCCFDVVAKPTIKVTSGLLTLGLTDVSDVDTGCGRLFSATYEAGGLGVNLSIILPQQNAMGDGNDLMIDNISVAKLESVPSALVDFKIEGGTNVGDADVTILGPLASPFTWEWQLWTGGPGLPNGTAVGPAVIGGATHTFTGLSPDVIYYVTLKVKSPCHKQTGKYLNWGYGTRSIKAAGKPMDILDAGADKTEKGPETPKRRNE